MLKYTASMSRLDTAWAALEDVAAGLPLPPRFGDAVAKAKREFFAPDYADLRLKTLKALIAGEKVDVSQPDWSRMSVAKLAIAAGRRRGRPRCRQGACGGAARERDADAQPGAGPAGGGRWCSRAG